MTNITLTGLSHDQLERITKIIEEPKPALALPKPPFENGDNYIFISVEGSICISTWSDHPYDHKRYTLDRAHPDTSENRAMLTARVAQQKAVVEVNRRVQMIIAEQHSGWVCNWGSPRQEKWLPYYSQTKGEVRVAVWCMDRHNFSFVPAPRGVYEQIDKKLIKKAMGIEDER